MTPPTPHNSVRYKPFMANGTKFFSIWEPVYRCYLHNSYNCKSMQATFYETNKFALLQDNPIQCKC